jgi:hypothetical protein
VPSNASEVALESGKRVDEMNAVVRRSQLQSIYRFAIVVVLAVVVHGSDNDNKEQAKLAY